MSLAANPGATSIVITTAMVPTAGATGPAAVDASDALGDGDVLGNEELCRKEIYLELNLATR
jgi:hypothetical protein